MKKAIVYTRDELLFRRLYLLLSGEYDIFRMTESTMDSIVSDLIIVDKKSCPHITDGDIILSNPNNEMADESHAGVVLPLPLCFEELENAIKKHTKRDTGRLVLLENERAVILDGVSIKLTDVEFRLLRTLLSVPVGEYVSKQKIVDEVWGDGVDGGVVNVYVHYLREKLEKGGERIIISTRNLGYKINERMVTVC